MARQSGRKQDKSSRHKRRQKGRCDACHDVPEKGINVKHHINQDRSDERQDNLEYVCLHCHWLRHLWRSPDGSWWYDDTTKLTDRALLAQLDVRSIDLVYTATYCGELLRCEIKQGQKDQIITKKM